MIAVTAMTNMDIIKTLFLLKCIFRAIVLAKRGKMNKNIAELKMKYLFIINKRPHNGETLNKYAPFSKS